MRTARQVARLLSDSGLLRVARPDPAVSSIRERVYEPACAAPAPQPRLRLQRALSIGAADQSAINVTPSTK